MTWRYLSVSAAQPQPCPAPGEEIIADIDNGLRVEDEGLAELIVGSAVTLDNIRRRSYGGWFLSAAQAL
jgi:hypothetical protein